MCEVVNDNKWRIITMEIMTNDMHLFFNVKLTTDLKSIITKFAGIAANHLRKKLAEFLVFIKLSTWDYVVSTAGNISREAVKNLLQPEDNKVVGFSLLYRFHSCTKVTMCFNYPL
ncbi:transposase [Umezakia ovalisporum]|uniref:Transposase n=1 Tax=Umezakia ovalisporum FSS-43 TaxID=2740520 RepID=A0ABT6K6I9_9CYAN|nr:transposase [Umezakia ovalisporum]MDH6058003.1 transposase [Umezakia ovalisporum FSS-43]MDH6072026.1 transposase [Umezakia ovalisporum CobakiLakeA]MDH6074183.1 transposase [Umezakia ovalisporum CS-1034]MDH6082626.1 transposase [Umezakia ovalisporum FSS-44]MDH6096769.1 transposase [Umezakia ovalisporum CobakiLakeB]